MVLKYKDMHVFDNYKTMKIKAGNITCDFFILDIVYVFFRNDQPNASRIRKVRFHVYVFSTVLCVAYSRGYVNDNDVVKV